MTEWYYTDAQRQQRGPVDDGAMAALHASGDLQPETLVWRDGMASWRPWRDMMGEVVAPTVTAQSTVEDPLVPVVAADPFAAGAQDDGAYRPYEMVDASPYAPPTASVEAYRQDDIVYAGFRKRLAAGTIDGVIIGCVMCSLAFPLLMLSGIGTSMMGASGTPDPIALGANVGLRILINLALALLPCFYFAWMQSSTRQASLGKQAVGIKVVRSDGSALGFGRAFLRQLGHNGIGLVTCSISKLISAIVCAATDRKQALHDMMADTVVVDEYAFTDQPHLQRRELGTVATTVLILLLVLIIVVALIYGSLFATLIARQS